jgi:N-acetylmuramoyl-L-alanine amidase
MSVHQALALLSVLLALAPDGARAGRPVKDRRPTAPTSGHTPAAAHPPQKPPGSQASPALGKARTQLASLMRNPQKRRYRHNWEKAIRDLERAATGRDRGPALLDAARARYALYRFSAIERDREQAIALAERSAAAGTARGTALAAAIRREAGEDEPRPTVRRKGAARPAHAAPARAPARAAEPAGDADTDPELDEEVAGLAAADPEPVAGSPAAPAAAAEGPAHVSEVKTWTNADYTRVAVYLSRAVPYQPLELQASGEQPRRLALDLHPALLDGMALRKPVGDALVERVRAAQRDPDTVRVVLDLASRDRYQLFTLDDPPRVIVDVGTREAREPAVAGGAGTPPGTAAGEGPSASRPEARPPAAASLPAAAPLARAADAVARVDGEDEEGEGAARRVVRRVIVDAGHGGHDTGAIGPHGVREKDVTLAISRRLARRLQELGFEVFLTRNDDRYLRLEERTAIANVRKGDLFVSIHANAHPRRDRRGVETYFLNVTDDRYARRLAARENGLVLEDDEQPGVQRILTDLNAQASAGASQQLARMVQRELTGRVRRAHGDVRDLGVKHALFYVLLGARMPAVLVETAFISNRAEERRLASPDYQQLVADGVAKAVADYAGGAPRVAAR